MFRRFLFAFFSACTAGPQAVQLFGTGECAVWIVSVFIEPPFGWESKRARAYRPRDKSVSG